MTGDFMSFKEDCGLDYTIGSVHLVRNANDDRLWFIDGSKVESYDDGLKNIFQGDVRLAVTSYYEQLKRMILSQKPDIIGHFDKINATITGISKMKTGTYCDLLDTIELSGGGQ
jgi:histidinol-phosphatase (PHP family)